MYNVFCLGRCVFLFVLRTKNSTATNGWTAVLETELPFLIFHAMQLFYVLRAQKINILLQICRCRCLSPTHTIHSVHLLWGHVCWSTGSDISLVWFLFSSFVCSAALSNEDKVHYSWAQRLRTLMPECNCLLRHACCTDSDPDVSG